MHLEDRDALLPESRRIVPVSPKLTKQWIMTMTPSSQTTGHYPKHSRFLDSQVDIVGACNFGKELLAGLVSKDVPQFVSAGAARAQPSTPEIRNTGPFWSKQMDSDLTLYPKPCNPFHRSRLCMSLLARPHRLRSANPYLEHGKDEAGHIGA